MEEHSKKTRLKIFWNKYETKIVLILGFLLVATISFEVGALKGADFGQKPMIIEKSAKADSVVPGVASQAQNTAPKAPASSTSVAIPPTNCAFVASKNSTKFHLATCRYVKSIKPENRVCFSSQDEAQSKGYVPDKNCIK